MHISHFNMSIPVTHFSVHHSHHMYQHIHLFLIVQTISNHHSLCTNVFSYFSQLSFFSGSPYSFYYLLDHFIYSLYGVQIPYLFLPNVFSITSLLTTWRSDLLLIPTNISETLIRETFYLVFVFLRSRFMCSHSVAIMSKPSIVLQTAAYTT